MKKDQRCDIRVIDNYFDKDVFDKILNFFDHEQTHWFLTKGISDPDLTAETSFDSSPLDSYFFCHPVYDHMVPRSTSFNELIELIEATKSTKPTKSIESIKPKNKATIEPKRKPKVKPKNCNRVS